MNRGQFLFETLAPHLNHDDRILDYCCGMSQIAEYLIDKYQYIGFDYDPYVIKKMNEVHSNGTFDVKDFVDIEYEDIDVLLFFRSSFTPYTTGVLQSNISKLKPRIIFMDSCLRKRYKDNVTWYEKGDCGLTEEYTRLNIFLIKLGYEIIDKGQIDDKYYYQIFKT
jgi:hypothetical protein